MYTCIHAYVCVCVCMCVYIYRQNTDKWRHDVQSTPCCSCSRSGRTSALWDLEYTHTHTHTHTHTYVYTHCQAKCIQREACRAVVPLTRHPSSINDCQSVCARVHTHIQMRPVSCPYGRARRAPTLLGLSGKRNILWGECLGNLEHVTRRPLRCPTYVSLVQCKTRLTIKLLWGY